MLQAILTELERLSWIWKGTKCTVKDDEGVIEGLDKTEEGSYIASVKVHQEIVRIPLIDLELTSEGV